MKNYVFKRLLYLIFIAIGITMLSFVLVNIAPVDPAEAYVRRISPAASEVQIAKVREELGLDKPVYLQYWQWVNNAVCFNFGKSLISGRPVGEEIRVAFPATFILTGTAAIIIVITAIPLGILSAVFKNQLLDHIIRGLTLAGISMPGFWLGFILLYCFAVKLKLVPVVGYGKIEHVLLPAITLAVPIISWNVRLLRTNMLENMNKRFVFHAKARGIKDRRIVWKHVFRNAVSPLVTLFGQTIGYMVAGTAIIESIFSWPGMGLYAVTAVMNRDLPAINAYVLIMSFVFVTSNFLADIINIFLNPALRQEGEEV